MPRWMGREGVMLMKASLLGVLAVAAVVSGCVAPAQPPGPPVMAIYAPPPADYRGPPVGPVGRQIEATRQARCRASAAMSRYLSSELRVSSQAERHGEPALGVSEPAPGAGAPHRPAGSP